MASMAQAIRMALHYGESHLNVTDIFGQDVGAPLGGVFTATQGLKNAWNTPLDERGIISAAIGIGLAGDRCVAEIQFADYIFNTIDLLKIAGNTLWASNGQYPLPIVVMTPVGAGIRGSIYHSHSFDSWATRMAGWKIVMPSTPRDAYGLMISAILDPNPVMYLNPKALMRVRGTELIPGEPSDEKELKSRIDQPVAGINSSGRKVSWRPNWPEGLTDFQIPIGKAAVTREGDKATLVTYGRMVHTANKVADMVREEGQAVDVIDLRSLYPYDWAAIKASVQKTKRVLFVNEDTEVTNFGEHLCYRTTTELFYELEARPRVLAGRQVPGIGLQPNLEEASVPQLEDVMHEVRELLSEVP